MASFPELEAEVKRVASLWEVPEGEVVDVLLRDLKAFDQLKGDLGKGVDDLEKGRHRTLSKVRETRDQYFLDRGLDSSNS